MSHKNFGCVPAGLIRGEVLRICLAENIIYLATANQFFSGNPRRSLQLVLTTSCKSPRMELEVLP